MKTTRYENFELTKLQRYAYSKQMTNFLLGQDFNYFITLNFFLPTATKQQEWQNSWADPGCKITALRPALDNLPVGFSSGKKAIKRWQAMVDRKLLGRNWSETDTDQRLFFLAFPEQGRKSTRTDNNLHYHLLAWVPYDQERFEDYVEKAWQKIIPSGEADCQRIGHTDNDKYRTRNYATKRIGTDDGISNFIISTEFQT